MPQNNYNKSSSHKQSSQYCLLHCRLVCCYCCCNESTYPFMHSDRSDGLLCYVFHQQWMRHGTHMQLQLFRQWSCNLLRGFWWGIVSGKRCIGRCAKSCGELLLLLLIVLLLLFCCCFAAFNGKRKWAIAAVLWVCMRVVGADIRLTAYGHEREKNTTTINAIAYAV